MARLKKYTIKSGKHYSGFRLSPFYGKHSAKYEVIFDKNCIYDLKSTDQYDVNKLFGLAYGYHHIDSVRFGWRAEGDKIEISAYCYKNGDRHIREMCLIDVDKPYVLEIKNTGVYYELELKDEASGFFSYARISKPITTEIGYNLFPYFGGNQVAPHEMTIFMRKIY
jgi:hypothetical protein